MVWIPAALEVQPDPLVAKPCVVAGLWGAAVWMLASHCVPSAWNVKRLVNQKAVRSFKGVGLRRRVWVLPALCRLGVVPGEGADVAVC